jgi:hypothetical protein
MSEVIRDEKGRIVEGSASLNPNGRPKKKVFSEYAREHLTDEIAKEIFDSMITYIKKGNISAVKELLDRVEGTTKQTIEHEGESFTGFDIRIIKDAKDIRNNSSISEELPE